MKMVFRVVILKFKVFGEFYWLITMETVFSLNLAGNFHGK